MSRTIKAPYRKSRAVDRTCRCHGSCDWCRGNRTFQERKARSAILAQLREEAA